MRAFLPSLALALACSSEPAAPVAPPAALATPSPAAQPAPETAPPLEHVVLLTGGATADQELPLLIGIHGLGSRPERFVRAFDGLDVPARVVLPLAPTPTASGGGSWFDYRRGDPDREALAERLNEAGAGLMAFVHWAEERYPTRGEPVITGFSQGGMLSFTLGATWPDHVAAAFPVGGDLPTVMVPPRERAPSDPPAIVAFHGVDDEVVPIGPVREAVRALADAGYPATLREYPGVGHSIPTPLRADWHAAVAEALGAKPGAQAAASCPPVMDRPVATPTTERISIGSRTLLVETCSADSGTTAVRASLEGSTWAWKGDFVYDEPSWENAAKLYIFEHGGSMPDGEEILALSYSTCEHDGCGGMAFYLVEPEGLVVSLTQETQAHGFGVRDGAFEYVERTGYSMGYHIASATWTYRYEGGHFLRQPGPVLQAEYERWPCPTGQVQPVDRATLAPIGDPVPVPQGAPIEVLDVDDGRPGELFEYKVNEQRFWAHNWQQSCAG